VSSKSEKSTSTQADEHAALVEQLQFLGQMSSTEAALFHHHAAAANGLGITDSKTLSALTQEGPMTAGEIAKRLGLTTGAVTNVIDRLVRAGFVRRVADPKDRRKVIVEADLANLEKLSHVYDSVADAFQKLHEQYSVEELHFLIDYFTQSVEVTKGEVAKLAASDE
jgi:MarR family transcriptional regulator, organic hydroperoxide resistance regulator